MNSAADHADHWRFEITLDALQEVFVMVVIDVHLRLPVAWYVTEGAADDFVAELDRTCQQRGYPEEVSMDPGFKFSTPILREWGARHGIRINYCPASNGIA